MSDWESRWMDLAELVATWSKDRKRKVGCVIVDHRQAVVALGWNGFPRGTNDALDERHVHPVKLMWSEHAERNAIFNAAAQGNKVEGAVLYSTFFPCSDCARAIVQAGISRVVTRHPPEGSKWAAHYQVVKEMLDETGVLITYVQAPEAITLDDKKREYVQEILSNSGGDRTKAAEVLGISRNTVSNILK